MASAQNVNAVLAAGVVAKNEGTPLDPTLSTQELLDASAYLVTQPQSDLNAITVQQALALLQNAGGVSSVVAGTNVTVDNTDPANPVISATGGGGGGDVAVIDAGTFTVDWDTEFGGLTSALHGGQCFEAQFDLISGFSGPRQAGDVLLVWNTDLSQAEGNGGTHVSKKIPITVGLRGATDTYADFRVIFHTMPCPDTSDLTPGFRPYNYHSSVTDSAEESYAFVVLRTA
jgi:hypothetical protein